MQKCLDGMEFMKKFDFVKKIETRDAIELFLNNL